MWLVADSGSTKTEWVLFDSKEREKLFTVGLNPLFLSHEEFHDVLRKSIPKDWILKVTKLWFYGAGCGSSEINKKVSRWLGSVFTKATIEVETDLMAAARSTCQTDKGIVAIVGTGSNSCYFDGKKIIQQVNPLGYILGDEGSGAALGKRLLKKLLRDQFSAELNSAIYKEIGMDYNEIIKRVYKSKEFELEQPNRFIASFAKIINKLVEEPEMATIVLEEFDQLSQLLTNYHPQTKVNVVGSVGYNFKFQLADALKKNGLELSKVVASPGDGLVNFHLNNN